MAVFQLEDLRASIEVMVFPKTMTEHGHKLEDDAIVIVRGRVDRKEDTAAGHGHGAGALRAGGRRRRRCTIDLTRSAVSDDLLRRLKGVLADHPGESEVVLQLSERQRVRLADDLCGGRQQRPGGRVAGAAGVQRGHRSDARRGGFSEKYGLSSCAIGLRALD